MAERRAEDFAILAVDCGLSSAVAFDAIGGLQPIMQTLRVPSNAGEYGPPLAKFQRWLNDLTSAVKPKLIAFEAPLVLGGRDGAPVVTNLDTSRLLFGFAAVVEIVAHDHGVPTVEVNVQTIKKSFAGHGFAKKEQMVARCAELGWEARDHHQADAAGIWHHVKSQLFPTWATTATSLFAKRRAS